MATGIRVNGPDGREWFNSTRMTTRTVGIIASTASAPTVSADFYCPSNTTPWAFAYASNGGIIVIDSPTRIDGSTARVTYANDGSGTPYYVFYGYGK